MTPPTQHDSDAGIDVATELQAIIETTLEDLSAAPDEEAATTVLGEFLIDTSEIDDDCDTVVSEYLLDMESYTLQIVMHGTPTLGELHPTDPLETALDLLPAYVDGEVTADRLQQHRNRLKDEVLEHRPETDVIGELGLEEAYSEAVRETAQELKHQQ